MINPVSCNRGYLELPRSEFTFFMLFTIFVKLAANTLYPGAPALILIIKNLFTDFGVAHAAKDTALADQIWNNILNAASNLSNYVNDNCGNDVPSLQTSGFTANKQHGVAEVVPGIPSNLRFMVLGGGNFIVVSENGETMHSLQARTRLANQLPPAPWAGGESSQNSTVHFGGYVHNTDVEVEIMAKGTHGDSLYSASVIVPVD
jgi:hypothetical protein